MALETVKRIKPAFTDDRGEIANIVEEPIESVAIITSKSGSIRGNHYHPNQIQYVYLVSGKYERISKDTRKKDGKKESRIITPGDLVITPPMIAHAMRFLEDSIILNLTTGSRDKKKYQEHTIKFQLV